MSIYTPTTQEVRNRYVFGTYWENDGDTSGGDNAPFNRWLAQHDAEVAKATEERFIELLEDPATMNAWWGMPDKNIGIYGNLAKYLIAKIRPDVKNK